MKTYTVTVTETTVLNQVLSIPAESADEAEEMARESWDAGMLCMDDFELVDDVGGIEFDAKEAN